jgi:hypothetical protein
LYYAIGGTLLIFDSYIWASWWGKHDADMLTFAVGILALLFVMTVVKAAIDWRTR